MDDMICVGATGPFTFTQNLDRNKFRIPGEAIEAIINCAQDFFDRMRNDHGIDISYNGGETADVNDLVRTLTVNASMQARMLRADVIDTKIKAGNVIVGLASDGRSSYEDAYNSGIGSNGLTALRHKLFGGAYTVLYPETYEGLLLEKKLAYTGQYRVTSLMPMADGSKIELGKLALSPTRTYAPIIKKMLAEIPKESISAMIHCSGGGQGKCLGFADGNVHIVKDSLFPTPSLFSLIQSESKETWENMYTTFNMGHRFEVYCDNAVADQIINISKSFKVDAKIVGYVEAAAETSLTIKSSYGDFDYVPEEK
jgi:phosphoribosylformylglycinamidine cyclo-ligase